MQAVADPADDVPSVPIAPTLEEAYREHADFVARVARALGAGPHQVEDVLHDVFVILHRRLPTFDGRTSLRSWLYGFTRRVVMHHQRRVARQIRREKRGPQPAAPPAPEEALVRKEAEQIVDAFLTKLDEDQRMVFMLAEIEEMPIPEIARALRINRNTAYSRLRIARRRFEEHVARHRRRQEREGDR